MSDNFFKNFFPWLIGTIVCLVIFYEQNLSRIFFPLIFVTFFAFFYYYFQFKKIEYILFFSISVASVFGLTETLTGFNAETTSILLFSLSFYSASIAYLISIGAFNYSKVLTVSNPLLLSTGPIALFIKPIFHKKIKNRFKYYFPFMIIGIFMIKVAGVPLTEFFF